MVSSRSEHARDAEAGGGVWVRHASGVLREGEVLQLDDADSAPEWAGAWPPDELAGAAWTLDGQRLGYIDQATSKTPVGIYTVNVNGGDRQLLVADAGEAAFSPDGTKLSFIDANGQPLGQALFTASIDGTGLHQLTPFTLDVGIKQSWAPDGSRITLTPNADFPDHLSPNVATINSDGSDLRYLTHYNAGGAAAFTGSYSPDGQWIVFRHQTKSTSTFGLFKMRPDGTRRTLIAELPFAPRGIDWGTHP